MAYKTDGSPHWNGNKNELFVNDFLNHQYAFSKDVLSLKDVIPNFDFSKIKFIHKGGTQMHADIFGIYDNNDKSPITISVKKKEIDDFDRPKGTFDLINTTINNPEISWISDWINIKKLNDFRQEFIDKNKNKVKKITDLQRNDFENVINASFENAENANKIMSFADSMLKKSDYLLFTLIKNKHPKYVCILDTKIYHTFYDKSITYFLQAGKGKSSRRIVFLDDNGITQPTPFRIRIVLNNGISHWLVFLMLIQILYELLKYK